MSTDSGDTEQDQQRELDREREFWEGTVTFDDNTDREALAKAIHHEFEKRTGIMPPIDRLHESEGDMCWPAVNAVLAVLPSLGWVKAEPEKPYIPGDAGAEYFARMRKMWGNDKRVMQVVAEAQRDYERRHPLAPDTTKEPTP